MRPLTTNNQFQVSADPSRGHVICRDLRGTMTSSEAIELAAWLCKCAEEADPNVNQNGHDDNVMDHIFKVYDKISNAGYKEIP
jgi:hypothetical protein